jgi:hypothetical protein
MRAYVVMLQQHTHTCWRQQQASGADLSRPALPPARLLQCGEEEEAVSLCLRQANAAAALQISAVGVAAAPGAAAAAGASAGGCELVIETFRFCRLHTQQHNYPAAPAFLC